MKHSVARKGKSPHRKKLRGGQVVVPVNPLETHVYVNFTVTGTTITSATTTDGRISTGTIGAGTIQLNINPAGSTSVSAPPLTTLKNYSVFGYNGSDTKWTEIPREKLDMGGTTVALYGVEPNIHIRKQRDPNGKIVDGEISVPADINAFGGVLNFGNISDDVFGFTAAASPITTNVYIQLVFTLNYPTPDTKWSGWNPATVPGLSLWLDGVEPGLNGFTPNTGIPVPNWNDKSGKNNHGSSSSAPVYQSNPALTGTYKMGMYLNGTSAFMSGSIKNDMNYCATFSVVSPDAGTVLGRRIISLSAPGISDTAGTNIYTNVVYNSRATPTNSLSFVGTLDSTIALSTTFVPIRAANSPFVVSSVVTNNGVVTLANGANMFLCQGFISTIFGASTSTLTITSAPPGVIYIDSTITGPYDFNTLLQTVTQVTTNSLITNMSVTTNGGVGTYTVFPATPVPTTGNAFGSLASPVWFAVSNPIQGSTMPSRSNLNLSTYSIGKNNSGGDFFKGYVHEVLVYTRPISKQGRQTIEGYLAWKWGLQANLHPRHPYRLVAPTFYSPSVSIPLMFPKIKPLLWLDAEDPQANDGTILPVPNTPLTGWYDKSGNDNHGVTITTFAPRYRPNSVVFNGTGAIKAQAAEFIRDSTGVTDIFKNRSCIAFYPNGNAVISCSGNNTLSNVINGTLTLFKSDLRRPSGIVFDSKGNMYITEISGHVVRRYGVADNYATGVIIVGTYETQTTDYGLSGPTPGDQVRLNEPVYIIIDKNDVIYINEYSNHMIKRIRLTPNSDPTVARNWIVDILINMSERVTGITVDSTATFLYTVHNGTSASYVNKITISTGSFTQLPTLTVATNVTKDITCDEFGILYIPISNGILAYNTEQRSGAGLGSGYTLTRTFNLLSSPASITYYNNTLYCCCENGNSSMNVFYIIPVPRPTYLYSLLTTPMSNFANIFIVYTGSEYGSSKTGIFTLGSGTTKETYTGGYGDFSSGNVLSGTFPEDAGPSSSYIGIYYNGYVNVARKNTHISNIAGTINVRPTIADPSVTRPPGLLYVSSNSTTISLRTNGGNGVSYTNTYLPFNIGAYGIGLQPSNIRRIAELLRTHSAAAMTYSFDGYVYEVIVYMNEMSDVQYKMMEAYLCWKWAIPLVDTTNPFFTSATTPPNAPVIYYDTVPTPITNMVFSDINTNSVFTGSISGTTLTVTAITSGTIQIGATINTALGGTITAYVNGTIGGVAVYTVSVSQTVASGTITASRNFSGVFRGGVTGSTLTVTSIVSGRIYIGATIHTPTEGTISAFVSGINGGIGVYTLGSAFTVTQTVAAGTLITSSVGFTLSWRGGVQATNYTYAIVRSTTSITDQPAANNGVTLNSISYTTTLINRALYYYTITVTPRNMVGAGTAGQAILLRTPALPTRTVPTTTGFTVNITAVTEASSYRIYLNEVRYGQITSGTTLAVTNLPSGATYFVTATAVSSTGHETPPSPVLVARTLPTAPSNIVISNWIAGGFTLGWSGAIGATSYTFTGATPTTLPQMVNGILTKSAKFTGLTSTTAYTITITAVNAGSDNSPTAGTIQIPAAPILTSNSVQQTQFTLAFTTVTGASSYNVYINGMRWTSTTISPSATIINGQPQGAILYITVAAVINATEMWPSPVLIVALTLPPLTNFSSSNMTTNSFTLNWLGGDGSTSYLYSFGSDTPLPFTNNGDNGVSQKNVTFTGGSTATTYVIYVQGRNIVGGELSTTGNTIIVTGSIGGNLTLTVTSVPSGSVVPLGGYLHTPTGGVIVNYSTGTNGGTGTYGISLAQTVTSQPIKISTTNIITIWQARSITRDSSLVISDSGFRIQVASVTGPTQCNIYCSSNSGTTYNLALSNQTYGASTRNYTLNTTSVFIGSITNNVLTVSSITSGRVYVNAYLIVPDGVRITGFLTGTNGGLGTYSVSTSVDVNPGTTFTAKLFGVNLYVVAKLLDSNGVEGWATNPPFQQRISPGTPTNIIVSFPNITTNQRVLRVTWSGGYGATRSSFTSANIPTAPATGSPVQTGNSYSATANSITTYTNISLFMITDKVVSSSSDVQSSTVTILIPNAPNSMGGMVTGTVRRATELNYWFNAVSNTATRPVIASYNIYVGGVFNRNTTTPTNTLITLPAGTATALINVRAVDASGNEGFPSATFTSTLLAPTAPVIGTITGTLAGGFVMPWTGADTAVTITIAYTSGTGPQPTINLAAKTATFTGLSARSAYTGTIIATNAVGSSPTVNWSFSTYITTGGYLLTGQQSLGFAGGMGVRFIAVDSTGNLYIASQTSHSIFKVTPDGTYIRFAGTGARATWLGTTYFNVSRMNGPATACPLNYPIGVAVDSVGNVYFTDQNSCVYKVDTNRNITLFAGLGTQTAITYNGPATGCSLSGAHGLAVDSADNIYITENVRHCVRKVTTNGNITTIAGTGFAGPYNSSQLNSPTGITVDSVGNVYIADTDNQCIRKVTTDGNITTIAGTGEAVSINVNVYDASKNGGLATACRLSYPYGIAVDSTENVYFTEYSNSCIRKVTTDGNIVLLAGDGTDGFYNAGRDNNLATSWKSRIHRPRGLALDSTGKFYFTEEMGIPSIRMLS